MKKISSLEDKNDAYERKDTVIISGTALPPADTDEHCVTLTCQLIEDHLNFLVSPNNIYVIHQLSEKKQLKDRTVMILL